MKNQNKPQDNVPKVEKSTEREKALKVLEAEQKHNTYTGLRFRDAYKRGFTDGSEWMESDAQSRIAELEKQNEQYREALERIQEWQMDYVEIARATKVYQIAEQALKDNG